MKIVICRVSHAFRSVHPEERYLTQVEHLRQQKSDIIQRFGLASSRILDGMSELLEVMTSLRSVPGEA